MKKNDFSLRSKDVAWILDCSPDDALTLAHRGRLKAVKKGRFWRFNEADVMRYKKAQDRHNSTRS